MRNLGFANLFRTWMNTHYKTPDGVAADWGIQRATVVGLLRGDLIPSDGQVAVIAKRMNYGESVVRDAINGKEPQKDFSKLFESFFTGSRK